MLIILCLATLIKCTSTYINDIDEKEKYSEDFSVVIKKLYFVDKTFLIRLFLDDSKQVTFVSMPPGFGKSTNMDMIKRFCEIKVNDSGEVENPQSTENYNLFVKRYSQKYNEVFLDIYKGRNKDFFFDHFGSYPVIFLDFKDLRGADFYNFIIDFIRLLMNLYHRHKYVVHKRNPESPENSIYEQYQFCRYRGNYRNYDVIKNINDHALYKLKKDLTTGVMHMCEYLYNHFKKKVILLIDHYDYPLLECILKNGTDAEKLVNFYQDFWMNVLDRNFYIKKALLNSRMQIGNEEGVRYISFHEKHRLNKYYGLTENEMEFLSEKFNVQDKIESIKHWYGGYRTSCGESSVYNVYAVTNYLQKLSFESFLLKYSRYTDIIRLCFQYTVLDKIEIILSRGSNRVIVEWKSMVDIVSLNTMLIYRDNSVIFSAHTHLFLSLLLDLGYFTVSKIELLGRDNYFTLIIPNLEMINELERYCRQKHYRPHGL